MLAYELGLRLLSYRGICQACHLYASDEMFLCQACQADMAWLPPAFMVNVHTAHAYQQLSIQPATYYLPPMSQAIFRFKDHEDVFALPYLLHGLAHLNEYLQQLPDDTVILPVPTTHRRLADRGFAPVDLLARYLSKMTDFALYHGIARQTDGKNQRTLDKTQRRQNVQDAFVVCQPTPSNHIVLFDDVATTGTTLASIAQCLWHHDNDKQIIAVCLAHGRP